MAQRTYDLVVIGGGIFGVCAAWDATLRGLSVALLERGDFSHATSANSYKIVHGGIRYVQQADLALVRESSHERTVLLRVAPHLVHPLPIVIPTYGYGMKGKPILRMGLLIYDLLTLDRNRGIDDRQRKIPFGRFLSREELLGHFSCVPREGLTGGAIGWRCPSCGPPSRRVPRRPTTPRSRVSCATGHGLPGSRRRT
jgi:glycerol-3-phosphate dehydrogenase